MKKILFMTLAAATLTACTRESITEMETLQANVPALKKNKEAVATAQVLQWQIEPAGVNPLRYRTTLALQLNNWEQLKKEAAKANWNYLQLSVEATPQTPVNTEEYSQPLKNTFTLFFNRIDLNTGIVYFENKDQGFSLRFPENTYEISTAQLTVRYQVRANDAKLSGLEEIFKASSRVRPNDVMAIGGETFEITYEPLVRVKSGNPYRVDVFNPANGATTPFVVYAADAKYIQLLFDNSKQAGKAKLSITPVKETDGLPEVQCFFNVETLQLISMESKEFIFCSFGDKPPLGGDEDGGVFKQDGRGTRSSTSTAQNKPQLL